LVGMQRNQLVR